MSRPQHLTLASERHARELGKQEEVKGVQGSARECEGVQGSARECKGSEGSCHLFAMACTADAANGDFS